MPDQSEIEVLVAARDWKAEGHGVALATVIKTWGSSPRPAGSHLVVRDDGFRWLLSSRLGGLRPAQRGVISSYETMASFWGRCQGAASKAPSSTTPLAS